MAMGCLPRGEPETTATTSAMMMPRNDLHQGGMMLVASLAGMGFSGWCWREIGRSEAGDRLWLAWSRLGC